MKKFVEKLISELKAGRNKECANNVPYIRLCDAISIVNELAEEYNNGWIPCSERLPDQYDYPEQNYRVLASCTDGIVRNTTIKSLLENKEHYNLGGKFYYNAWMPLPEPYQQTNERSE